MGAAPALTREDDVMEPALGPQPATRPAVSDARRRVLEVVARLEATEPPTVPAVALHVGGHPNASRQHLDALCQEGLLAVESAPGGGRGRPSRRYRLTRQGRYALVPADRELQQLVTIILDYLTDEAEPGEAHRLGRYWGRRQARADELSSDADPVAMLAGVFEALGFEPQAVPAGDGADLLLPRCPLLALAPDHREFMCALHEGFVQGILDGLAPGTSGAMRPFSDPGACRLEIRLPPPTRRPPRPGDRADPTGGL